MDRARRTRLKRRALPGLLAALWLHAAASLAALPEPTRFAADIDAGKVDIEHFDFAAAGFWDAALDARWTWFGTLQSLLDLNPAAHGGCDEKSLRRFAVAAWFLVQHADREPDFQRRMLAYLQGLPEGHTSAQRIAYLWDRVAGQDGTPQRYATQGVCQPDGSWKPHPVEDPERLDERRVALGMKPIAEHIAAMGTEYCPPLR